MNPLLLAGGAAEIGSTVLNMAAQDQINAARKAAQDAENARQARWDGQIANLQNQTLQGYDGMSGKMANRAQNVADFYKATGGSLPSSGPTTGVIPTSANPALMRESANAMGKVGAFNTQQGTALGNLRSFGDIMAGNARTGAVNNGLIAGIDSMKQGSSNMLPLELKAANNAGNGLKTFADILNGVGQMGVSAGLGGTGGSWFSSPISGSRASTTITGGLI